MERQLIRYCPDCGCSLCARRNDCPNEGYACGECTPDNPAWNCICYDPLEKGDETCED